MPPTNLTAICVHFGTLPLAVLKRELDTESLHRLQTRSDEDAVGLGDGKKLCPGFQIRVWEGTVYLLY